jgi:hypothetical protein
MINNPCLEGRTSILLEKNPPFEKFQKMDSKFTKNPFEFENKLILLKPEGIQASL